MPTKLYKRNSVYVYVSIAACLTLSAACASDSDAPLICPDCAAAAPGEGSSSSSGSVAGCSLAYLERSIDRSEAESLGFPVADAAAQIERPIDAPVEWVAQASEGGGPAKGFERETRIQGAFKVESYSYHWLDPERCDGSVCKLAGGQTTEQAPCMERYMMMHVSGALATLDGALATEFPSQAVNLRRPGQLDDIVVAAGADLSRARGSLMIDPDVPPPRVGRIDLSLQFADKQHSAYGVLSVSVYPDWDNLSDSARSNITSRFARYAPIEARWGDYPFDTPTVSSLSP